MSHGGPISAEPGMGYPYLKIHKGIWILKCRECEGRNLAESWKRSRLLVNDENLRPLGDDEVFLHQIEGAVVVDSPGKLLGKVSKLLKPELATFTQFNSQMEGNS